MIKKLMCSINSIIERQGCYVPTLEMIDLRMSQVKIKTEVGKD